MSNDNELYFITLYCQDCEHPTCGIGSWVDKDDGCTRRTNEDLYIEYLHQINEIWPFNKNNKEYNKTIKTLYKVYRCGYGKKLGKHHFKPVTLKEEDI